jgi:hemolysin III
MSTAVVRAETLGEEIANSLTHGTGALLAVAGLVPLTVTAAAEGEARRIVGCSVFGAALVLLYVTSTLYHALTHLRAKQVLRALDHSAIFLLIAGTYTPLSFLLGSRLGWTFLGIVWGGAVLGIVMSVAWVKAPKALVAVVCVLLGWAAVPLLPALKAALGTGAVVLLAAGGVVYSLGALVYAVKRPDPFPRVFGYHEIFHALVIAAAGCHFAVVARAVVALSA